MDVYTTLVQLFLDAYRDRTGYEFTGDLIDIASAFNIPGIQQAVDDQLHDSDNRELEERRQRSALRQLTQQFVGLFVSLQTEPEDISSSAVEAKATLKSAGCPYFPC